MPEKTNSFLKFDGTGFWFETSDLFEQGTFYFYAKKGMKGLSFFFSESCNISLTAASNFEKYGLEFSGFAKPENCEDFDDYIDILIEKVLSR